MQQVAEKTDGYSGSDLSNLVIEASHGPLRTLNQQVKRGELDLGSMSAADLRQVCFDDFVSSITSVRASVLPETLKQYVEWDKHNGSK